MAILTDMQIRRAKPAEKRYRLADGGGLFLHVAPTGSKSWRLRYRTAAGEQLHTLGSYPTMKLAEARLELAACKAALKAGRSLRRDRQLERDQDAGTFEVIAREWHALQSSGWVLQHAAIVLSSLEADVFPMLGPMPPREIQEPQVLSLLRNVERRGARDTARRIRQRVSAVFVYAVATGRADRDPAAIIARAMAPVTRRRQPAIINLDSARQMLRTVEAMTAHPLTKLALRLLALTAARPGPLVSASWSEFVTGGISPAWTIPAERMKLKTHLKGEAERAHVIPLSTHALDALDVLVEFSGSGRLLFPNLRDPDRPMSINTLGELLKRAGYGGLHVPHGFRAMFSSLMNEAFPADRAAIDLMLAHTPKDQVEAAYNRAQQMDRRRVLVQRWSDMLMEGAPNAREMLGLI